jgi:Kef-type K+ transport system membrane component KefB
VIGGVGGEILGGFLGSRLAGLKCSDALIVGIGLTGRAGIELAVIEVMRLAGLITLEIYSSFVVLTAVACVLMPLMLKLACKKT